MTILQALARHYDRLEGIAPSGWAPVQFGWCIVLDPEGNIVDVEDLRDTSSGKKPKLRHYLVPVSDEVAKRTSGIAANFLSDKSAYVLGRTAGDGKRTAREHATFKNMHLERLAGQTDEGLVALRRFLEEWQPERFDDPPFKPEMLDANLMFRLDGERGYLHQRSAARALVEAPPELEEGDKHEGFCLVSGKFGPIARLHRPIKGVENAQSSGAPLVSCNSTESPAFASYGKGQGLLAPTNEEIAFKYATALNHLLTRDGPNRIRRPIGDATVVFWADASEAKKAETADAWFANVLGGDISDEAEARKIGEELKALAKGKALADLRVNIETGTRFHVLGLSPAKSRLSVRYWLTGTLDQFARRLADHHADFALDPPPVGWGDAPSVNRLLASSTALQGKFENIPHLLAGEVMRAILSGTRYPQSLLAAAIMRLRAGDPKSSEGKALPIGWHAAVIRAVLFRDQRLRRRDPDIPEQGETPMSLKRDHDNPGYQLGRLFAVYELAQRSALGRVNATIRDKYFGAASATPASVFPLIVRGGQPHLAKVRKERPGWGHLIERELEEITSRFEPAAGGTWPRSLRLRDQGEFAIGYYHQRAAKLTSDKGEQLGFDDAADTHQDQGDE